MGFEKAQVVRSLRGRDKGRLYCVLAVQGDVLVLSDGKSKRVSAPKRKNVRHAAYVGSMEHPAAQLIRAGAPVGNGQLRRYLAAVRDKMEV